jgi:hypothetical protein
MPSENPLEIPEIMDKIAPYLKGKDCTNCVRVSKSWQEAFIPHIWRDINISSKSNVHPNPKDIYHRRHFIHSLSFVRELFGLGTFVYPNLRKLHLKFRESRKAEPIVSVDLVETCPLLTHLELDEANVTTTTWMALSTHPHIMSLQLRVVRVESVDAPWFWKVCKKLESLYLVDVTLGGSLPEDAVFDQLRKLGMIFNGDVNKVVQMDLAFQSPMLESLEWRVDLCGTSRTGDFFRRPIQSNHWPNFRKLHLYHTLQDAEVASILRGAGNGQEGIDDLNLQYCELGTQASRILGDHFNTLVRVDISGCRSTRSKVLDLLCGCPNLKELHAKDVFAKDIAERGPWVCHQLQKLLVCFRVGESQQDTQLQQLVFQRLSTLTRLKKLMMWIPELYETVESVLEFRLDCGLNQLESLQELTEVIFLRRAYTLEGDYIPQFGMDEVAWMADNWMKLRKITGRLNTDVQMESQLITTVRSSGILYEEGDMVIW